MCYYNLLRNGSHGWCGCREFIKNVIGSQADLGGFMRNKISVVCKMTRLVCVNIRNRKMSDLVLVITPARIRQLSDKGYGPVFLAYYRRDSGKRYARSPDIYLIPKCKTCRPDAATSNGLYFVRGRPVHAYLAEVHPSWSRRYPGVASVRWLL